MKPRFDLLSNILPSCINTDLITNINRKLTIWLKSQQTVKHDLSSYPSLCFKKIKSYAVRTGGRVGHQHPCATWTLIYTLILLPRKPVYCKHTVNVCELVTFHHLQFHDNYTSYPVIQNHHELNALMVFFLGKLPLSIPKKEHSSTCKHSQIKA